MINTFRTGFNKKGMPRMLAAAVLVSALGLALLALPAHAAATITVDSTADTEANDGVCTLREAITSANTDTVSGAAAGECVAGSGADTIEFDIAGAGPHVFQPASIYPSITESLTINGESQTGATCGPSSRDLPIVIDGGSVVLAGDPVVINFAAADSALRGITFYGLDSGLGAYFLTVESSDNFVLECNNMGTNTTATALAAAPGMFGALTQTSDNIRIGGTTASARNVFGGLDGDTVFEFDAGTTNSKFIGNHVGVDFAGTTALPISATTSVGLNDFADGPSGPANSGNIIGGATAAERNVFAAMSGTAVYISSLASTISDSQIIGNYFGTDANGNSAPAFAISGGGIFVGALDFFASGAVLTDARIANNLITNTGGAGITVVTLTGSSFVPQRVSILNNTIYDTGGTGIDLCETSTGGACDTEDGLTANDGGDTDTGPNAYINKPEITDISQVGDQITFTYDLDAIGSPTDEYYLQFFSNDAAGPFGEGLGQTLLGSTTVTAVGAVTGQTVTFTLPSNNDITSKVFGVTNTAVDAGQTYGYGATSEFGQVDIDVVVGYADDLDNDNDGIPNQLEDANTDLDNDPSTNPTDTDGDGIPDYLDIDSDNDGITDTIEALAEGEALPTLVGTYTDGIDDGFPTAGLVPADTDGDGTPDYKDLDSDNDGVVDAIEGHDANQDGIADTSPTGNDADSDGLDDAYDTYDNTTPDDPVNVFATNAPLQNTDGDSARDWRDTDDDNDGIPTTDEPGDANNNGTPDYLEVNGQLSSTGGSLYSILAIAAGLIISSSVLQSFRRLKFRNK